ncbi:hypothetical protein [Protofrankia symbiont of Coriaria ruscifolia]|uniref:Uncharacterized protein n=1 Tax=Candidatus Protofrankia californiensis TaxID=1839754 RepID=A0A1C3NVB0_9ACTN|nr:hypothetical protein [Protofrankia symbiont of Coriaria ruscifolia]SBW19353.1 hypothetical protein FDG2_1267 [Candidatus Protofrankia californiensis]
MNRTEHDYERYGWPSECPCCWTWAAWLIPPDFGAELLVRCSFPAVDIPLITERLIAPGCPTAPRLNPRRTIRG